MILGACPLAALSRGGRGATLGYVPYEREGGWSSALRCRWLGKCPASPSGRAVKLFFDRIQGKVPQPREHQGDPEQPLIVYADGKRPSAAGSG